MRVNCIAQEHKPRAAKCENCRTPTVCDPFGPEATRRVQESNLRWSREIGYEGADLATRNSAEPAPASNWLAGRALLLYAGTVLASALAAVALFINT